MRWNPSSGRFKDGEMTWDHIRGISDRVYGTPEALDPHSGYEAKAFPAYYHDKRSVLKDSVPSDDQVFPLIYSLKTEDRFFRVGDIDGPSVDYHLFRLGTGAEWSEAEFERAAERVYALERALNVRHWARDRKMDESGIPAFAYKENWENPELGQKYALDQESFRQVQDDYYDHLGWDKETGWPTRERLRAIGLDDVHEPMVVGAKSVAERATAKEPTPVVVVAD